MFGKLYSKKGFTLVELIVVVIIVGILASVALPMMSTNIDKAKKSEAVTVLGMLRTAARFYYAEKTVWPNSMADISEYINLADLNGRYYTSGNYTLTSTVITATNAAYGDPITLGTQTNELIGN